VSIAAFGRALGSRARRVMRLHSRIPTRIRDRLATWFLATLMVQMLIYALVVFVLMQRSLVSQVDWLLDTDTRSLTGNVVVSHDDASLAGGLGTLVLGSDAQATLWELKDNAPPKQLASTPGAPNLPAPAVPVAGEQTIKVQATDGQAYYVRSIDLSQHCQKHLATDLPRPCSTRAVIQAARPAALVSEPLSHLATMLLAGLLAVLLIGWIGGRALAGAALSPIRQIVRATRQIRLSRLGKRLREDGPNDELRELTHVINDLLQRFQDGLDRERRFAADVSHELRTPLTAQMVMAQSVLRKTAASPREYDTAIQHMLEEARHMEQFIERLLTLTRLATQPLAMALEPVDVHDAIHQTAATLQLLSDDKRHTLSLECAPGLQAQGEPTMLRQALMNIVHNAIDHCAPGAHIIIRAAVRQGRVVVEVDDDGAGVAPQARERLFVRFYRGNRSEGQTRRGLGLGLSIVKALMEAQGGSIHLGAKQQPGARFCLTLPLPSKRAAASPSILDAMESIPAATGEQEHALPQQAPSNLPTAGTALASPPPRTARNARLQRPRPRTS
jgi:signal transduction histidine kinase